MLRAPRSCRATVTRLLVSARALHDLLADCPWIAEALSFDDFARESALSIVESIAEAAAACGVGPEGTVYAYRVISHCTTGESAICVSRERAQARVERPEYRERALDFLDSPAFPRPDAIGRRWAGRPPGTRRVVRSAPP